VLVKSGGLKAMLACYLKNNKKVYKDFKTSLGMKSSKKSKNDDSSSDDEKKSKKRQRSNSNVSNGSKVSKKRDKKKLKKANNEKLEGMRTRRKSSVDMSSWKPKSEAEILAAAGDNVKEFKF
jgi:hypothetical protein